MVDLAAISFIGLGVQPPTAGLGRDGARAARPGVLQGYPAESLTAGLCIVVVVVAVNLLGERLAAKRTARERWMTDLHYLSATEALARFRAASSRPSSCWTR